MRFAVLLCGLAPVLASASSSSLQLLPLPNSAAKGVLALPGGSVAVFGATLRSNCIAGSPGACDQTETPLISILDASGKETASLTSSALGSGNSTIAGADVDQSANIWITGETDSDDFPLVHPLFTKKAAYKSTGFVAKLNLTQYPILSILFSTFLGGQEIPAQGPSTPSNIALDNSGNVWVVGSTQDSGFPTTASVLGTGTPSGNVLAPMAYTFLTKLSADGSALILSRLLGGNNSRCIGGSHCIGYQVYTIPSSIAVDSNGNLTVGGSTNAANFPTTPGVYGTGGGAFVSRISADGSHLIWSTEIGSTQSFSGLDTTFSSAVSITLDSTSNVYIAGSAPGPIATTPDALQSTLTLNPTLQTGFAAKLSSDAAQLLFATNLGGSNGATLYGLALDPSGNVWVVGNTTSADFPALSGVRPAGLDFALELNSSATALQQIFPLLPATITQRPAFDSNANLLLLDSAGTLLRLNPATASSIPAVFAIANSAVPRMTAGVAPGELLTLYGTGLGPSTGITGAPDTSGLFPRQLGGVTVQFGGIAGIPDTPAPLLYAGPNQINLQVPFDLTTPTAITITTPTATLGPIQLPVIGSIGLFGVLNADGTVNSASNPASAGSVVAIYLTGLGTPGYPAQDGAISPSASSVFQNSIQATWRDGLDFLPVWYAGTAPELINGVDQVNFQLPVGAQNPVVSLQNRTTTSNQISIYTH